MIVGSVLYFPALVWDAVGGIYGVKSYNAKIEKKKHSLMEGVQPILAITESGAFAGLRIQF